MTKYKLKEIWDISEKERDEIYRYALERSYEICGSPELDEETMERIKKTLERKKNEEDHGLHFGSPVGEWHRNNE